MADLVLGPKQNVWLYYDPARAAWTAAVTPHTSGGLSGGLNGGAAETISGNWIFSGNVQFTNADINEFAIDVNNIIARTGVHFSGWVSPAALASGTTDNYNPSQLQDVFGLRITPNAAGSTLGGLTEHATEEGQLHILCNIHATANLTIAHEALTSTASNRFLTATGADRIIGPRGYIVVWHEGTSNRWREIAFGSTDASLSRSANESITGAWTFSGGATVNGGLTLGTDLAVPNGGTGVSTFAVNGVLYGQGASAILVTAQGAANSVLTANAGAPSFSAAPVIGTSITVPSILTASGALTITPAAGSNLNVVLSAAGDFVVNTNQLYVDTSTGYLGLSVLVPVDRLHLVGATTAGDVRFRITALDTHARIQGMRANGSYGGGETALLSGNVIGEFAFGGYDGSAYRLSTCAVVVGATENWTTTALGSNLDFQTTATGSVTRISRLLIDGSGNIGVSGGISSSHATAGIGYATGAGGAVTQATSKSTGVTLNTVTGIITMNAASLAADTTVSFILTDSAIVATDAVIVIHESVGTLGAYSFASTAAAGSASISVHNNTPGSLSEAIVLRFVVIKSVNA